jgi:hypothetical protein
MNKTEIKLKVVAEAIKDILRKNDVAAAVVLHSPGHGEYFVHLNPSYSCAYMYNDNEIRFYSKRKDYKTAEEQHEKQVATANMLCVLADITALNYLMLEPLNKKFDEITGAEHS